ncbi:MAG TPA: sulfatase, partial [Candidatus Hydrogenedentes bacterium]|nr:sulfatase [Candidatus Hydrogenedentota bacterium]
EHNLLVIVIDALRADHLGCYGYARPTSPFLDTIAAEGVVFDRAQSNSSYTNESVSALFSGQFPSANPWGAGWQARPNPEWPTLGERFRDAGYTTGLFSNSPQLNYPGFFRGFDETDCYAAYGHSGLAPRLVDRALRFARDHRDKKTFLYLHFLDPHAPYDPPEEYYQRFARYPVAKDKRLRLFEDVRPNLPALVADGFGPGDPRFEDLIDRYDAEIAFVDAHLKKLFDGLRAAGVLEKTLVVVTADHGEEFLEHGFVEHAWQLYWESLHVPLIVWAPRVFAPARVPDRISLVNIAPTLLTFAGIPYDPARFDGAALFRHDGTQWSFQAHARPIIAELLIQTRNLARMVHADERAYMAAPKWMTPAECSEAARRQRELRRALIDGQTAPIDLWGAPAREELYDLTADPAQRRDIFEETAAAPFRTILDEYRDRCPAPALESEKIRAEMGQLPPDLREQLEAIGYTDGAGPAERAPTLDPALEEQLRNLGYF